MSKNFNIYKNPELINSIKQFKKELKLSDIKVNMPSDAELLKYYNKGIRRIALNDGKLYDLEGWFRTYTLEQSLKKTKLTAENLKGYYCKINPQPQTPRVQQPPVQQQPRAILVTGKKTNRFEEPDISRWIDPAIEKLKRIEAQILDFVKKHPEQDFVRTNGKFGTEDIVYKGRTADIDGFGRLLQKAVAVDDTRKIIRYIEDYIKKYPEQNFVRTNGKFGTKDIVYRGKTQDINGLGQVLQKAVRPRAKTAVTKLPSDVEQTIRQWFHLYPDKVKKVLVWAEDELRNNPSITKEQLFHKIKTINW